MILTGAKRRAATTTTMDEKPDGTDARTNAARKMTMVSVWTSRERHVPAAASVWT